MVLAAHSSFLASGTCFACALGPCVCTLEPEPDLEISRACADF